MKLINLVKKIVKNLLPQKINPAKFSHAAKMEQTDQLLFVDRKMNELFSYVEKQTEAINRVFAHLGIKNSIPKMNFESFNINNGYQGPPNKIINFEKILKETPLLFARKTYNTSHPEYDANVVRNYPDKVFNFKSTSDNAVYLALKKITKRCEILEKHWSAILSEALVELRKIPYADQVFERKFFIEKYLDELAEKYGAYYRPGWVNLDDALFLYWIVRKLNPEVIVQTGVCNGLSSAFMMLALVKNGPKGRLHVIDMPPVFDSNDDSWKLSGKVYGVTIPEGKSSGWIVPEAYHERFEVLNGDAKILLPKLLDKLGRINMFYHDSDHTYDHMMFEFIEAKKYLEHGGVIVSDDIAWNSSLWDFADQYHVPAYNYRGSMGIACF